MLLYHIQIKRQADFVILLLFDCWWSLLLDRFLSLIDGGHCDRSDSQLIIGSLCLVFRRESFLFLLLLSMLEFDLCNFLLSLNLLTLDFLLRIDVGQ